ncbi:hypothetical protein [Candidatus Poriferisocius sp.]|uniref:hypothetical protein n=1 Tax=Candidatus Poriferisocius sp. TaxID=3101276 RepID=UPI003B01BED8
MTIGPQSRANQAVREVRQGAHLLAEQNHGHDALRELLHEWSEETGLPDPNEVAAMRRRYFTQ